MLKLNGLKSMEGYLGNLTKRFKNLEQNFECSKVQNVNISVCSVCKFNNLINSTVFVINISLFNKGIL